MTSSRIDTVRTSRDISHVGIAHGHGRDHAECLTSHNSQRYVEALEQPRLEERAVPQQHGHFSFCKNNSQGHQDAETVQRRLRTLGKKKSNNNQTTTKNQSRFLLLLIYSCMPLDVVFFIIGRHQTIKHSGRRRGTT